jgi:hypothetical protein
MGRSHDKSSGHKVERPEDVKTLSDQELEQLANAGSGSDRVPGMWAKGELRRRDNRRHVVMLCVTAVGTIAAIVAAVASILALFKPQH